MKREGSVSLTPRKHVKERFRPVFTALSAEAKHFPGGIAELARATGRNGIVLANKLNPNQLDAQPTAEDLLELIETIGARRTVNSIARLAGQVAVDVCDATQSPREVMACFMRVVKDAGRLNDRTVEAMEDSRLDPDERDEIGALLDELIAASVEMRALVRG